MLISSLAWTGFKRSLTFDDLWNLSPTNSSSYIVPLFQRYWQNRVQKAASKNAALLQVFCCISKKTSQKHVQQFFEPQLTFILIGDFKRLVLCLSRIKYILNLRIFIIAVLVNSLYLPNVTILLLILTKNFPHLPFKYRGRVLKNDNSKGE